jgi:hypothetical protein
MVMWPFIKKERQKGISFGIALIGIIFFAVGLTNTNPVIFNITSQGIGFVIFIIGLIYFIESISN